MGALDPETTVDLDGIAALLGCTKAYIGRLVQEGVIPKTGPGCYGVEACIGAYVTHLRGRAEMAQANASTQLRDRLADAKALAQEQRNAIVAGSHVDIFHVAAAVSREYSLIRERILTIPGKLASALVGLPALEIEKRIRDEVFEALDELHDPGADRPGRDRGVSRRAAPARSTPATLFDRTDK